MNDKFWRGRRVLISGFEGFLGSHLTCRLLHNHARVVGLDIKTYRPDTIISDKERSKMMTIKGNVQNMPLLSSIIKKEKIEFVFHLAAEALVGKCFDNPLRAFSTNIKGTWSILEAARHNKSVKAIIVASSDKAYGDQIKLPLKESFPLVGRHPYDVSKSCADLLAYTYFHSYGLPVCVTRCGNIFGPGDFNFSRIIPDSIKSALKNKPLFIRSDGKFIRDYIYIQDIVDGYLILAKKMVTSKIRGESFNFSNENPKSVLAIVRLIYRLMKKKANYEILNLAKYEIKKQYLCSKKARSILGWKPNFSLEEGLKQTICWYRQLLSQKRQE